MQWNRGICNPEAASQSGAMGTGIVPTVRAHSTGSQYVLEAGLGSMLAKIRVVRSMESLTAVSRSPRRSRAFAIAASWHAVHSSTSGAAAMCICMIVPKKVSSVAAWPSRPPKMGQRTPIRWIHSGAVTPATFHTVRGIAPVRSSAAPATISRLISRLPSAAAATPGRGSVATAATATVRAS